MICREAAGGDHEQLIHMARVMTEESGLPVTFNESRARGTIWSAIHHNQLDFLVVADDDVLVGAALLMTERDYTDQILAYVDKFYVHQGFRGLGASDILVQGLLEAAEKRGAKLVFASATAGMGERIEKLYVRLFQRHGFTVLGRIIMKEQE